jgi:DNA-binding HxlR family transcriptional regulator
MSDEMTRDDLQKKLNITIRKYFRQSYLNKALNAGIIEMTEPDSPNSPNQKYRLTKLGKDLRKKLTDQ